MTPPFPFFSSSKSPTKGDTASSTDLNSSLSRRRFLKTTAGATVGAMLAMQIHSTARANVLTIPGSSSDAPNNWKIALTGENTTPDEPSESTTFTANEAFALAMGISTNSQVVIRRHVKSELTTTIDNPITDNSYNTTASGAIKVTVYYELLKYDGATLNHVKDIPQATRLVGNFTIIASIDSTSASGTVTEQIVSDQGNDNDVQGHGSNIVYAYGDGLTDKPNLTVSGLPAPYYNKSYYGTVEPVATSAKGAPDFTKKNFK